MYKYSLKELESLALKLSRETFSPFVFLLYGDLGSGKTTFSQFFIKNLLINKEESVTSPTFNIVQIYDSIKGPIWHVDLYRVKNEIDLEELGLLEAIYNYICLIEWPEIVVPYISDCRKLDICL